MSKQRIPPVSKDTLVTDLLSQLPAIVPVMVSHGFLCLSDPALRQAIPASLTLGTAASIHGVDLKALLRDLSQIAEQRSGAPPDEETLADGARPGGAADKA